MGRAEVRTVTPYRARLEVVDAYPLELVVQRLDFYVMSSEGIGMAGSWTFLPQAPLPPETFSLRNHCIVGKY